MMALFGSTRGITLLSLNGEFVILSTDDIFKSYRKDTTEEILKTLLVDEVKVKLPNGEIKDILEI